VTSVAVCRTLTGKDPMPKPTDLVDLRYGTDVMDGLRALGKASVQTAVTSPPYWQARDNRAEGQIGLENSCQQYIESLVKVFGELKRVLRPDGTFWLNVGDKYHNRQLMMIPYRLALALQQDGWLLRSIVIWQKPGGMPRNVNDRPIDDYEPVFLLAPNQRYFYDGEDLRIPSKYPAKVDGKELPVTSNIRTVWRITPENFRGVHTSIFPAELARRCILLTTPRQACAACGAPWLRHVDYQSVPTRPARKTKFGSADEDPRGPGARLRKVRVKQGETWAPSCDCRSEVPETERPTCPSLVLDPFSGSATTLGVASFLGRQGIGIDLSTDYLPVAQSRITEIHTRYTDLVTKGHMTLEGLIT